MRGQSKRMRINISWKRTTIELSHSNNHLIKDRLESWTAAASTLWQCMFLVHMKISGISSLRVLTIITDIPFASFLLPLGVER